MTLNEVMHVQLFPILSIDPPPFALKPKTNHLRKVMDVTKANTGQIGNCFPHPVDMPSDSFEHEQRHLAGTIDNN